MIDLECGEILSVAGAPGRVHDLALLRWRPPGWLPATPRLLDKGYQGLAPDSAHVYLPFKRRAGRALHPEQRAYNRLQGAIRQRVEHVIRELKRFHILALRYRNRRRRFHLRFHLIAAIYNLELKLAS